MAELAARGVAARVPEPGVVAFERGGVGVQVVTDANLRAHFAAQVEAFEPEIILASTDDPAQLLLEAALRRRAPAWSTWRAPPGAARSVPIAPFRAKPRPRAFGPPTRWWA